MREASKLKSQACRRTAEIAPDHVQQDIFPSPPPFLSSSSIDIRTFVANSSLWSNRDRGGKGGSLFAVDIF